MLGGWARSGNGTDKAQEGVTRAVAYIQQLRPPANPFDYWIWADETVQLLSDVYGASARKRRALRRSSLSKAARSKRAAPSRT